MSSNGKDFFNNGGGKKGGIKPQAGDPPGYNPGGETLKVSASVVKSVVQTGTIYMDLAAVVNAASQFGAMTYAHHTAKDANAMPREEWLLVTSQMMHFIAFKQLGSSMGTQLADVVSRYSTMAHTEISVPVGLVPLLAYMGKVSSNQGDFEVAGQPVWSATALLRAVGRREEEFQGVVQLVDVNTSVHLDLFMPHCWVRFLEWCLAGISEWTRKNQVRIALQDGSITTMYVNDVKQGCAGFFQAFQTTAFPVHVIQYMRMGALAEECIAQNLRVENVPVAMVQRFNAEGVVLTAWTRPVMNERLGGYLAEVQYPTMATLESIVTTRGVKTASDTGSLSQCVSRVGFENASTCVPISSLEAEAGAMMATERCGAVVNPNAFRVDQGQTSVEALDKWFRGMLRGYGKS